MIVEIHPGQAHGTVAAPPSKSMAHRLLICAGLAHGTSRIRGVALSQDILATIDCLTTLGANCAISGDTVTVQGMDPRTAKPAGTLCCRESGSTLRFFIPLALLSGELTRFAGTEQLLSRPLSIYENLCRDRGFLFQQDPSGLAVKGPLESGQYTLPGDISSQFITGLLFALPLTPESSTIRLLPPVESRSYIDLTLQALHAFGIQATWQDAYTLAIPGGQSYQSRDMTVEGDYSGAAFLDALNTLGSHLTVTGLDPESLQGDRVYKQHLQSLAEGCPTIDLSDCPDLGPILFAVAAARLGAIFTGTHRLKLKESNRAAAMAQELAAFGTSVTVEDNSVVVSAADFHRPDRILTGHNDHRIVMALAVLLTLTGGKLQGAQAVNKSFPNFFEKLKQSGITVHFHEADN